MNKYNLKCKQCVQDFIPDGLAYPSDSCTSTSILNCSEFNSDFSKCTKCKSGFYLKVKSEIYKIKTDNPVQILLS